MHAHQHIGTVYTDFVLIIKYDVFTRARPSCMQIWQVNRQKLTRVLRVDTLQRSRDRCAERLYGMLAHRCRACALACCDGGSCAIQGNADMTFDACSRLPQAKACSHDGAPRTTTFVCCLLFVCLLLFFFSLAGVFQALLNEVAGGQRSTTAHGATAHICAALAAHIPAAVCSCRQP